MREETATRFRSPKTLSKLGNPLSKMSKNQRWATHVTGENLCGPGYRNGYRVRTYKGHGLFKDGVEKSTNLSSTALGKQLEPSFQISKTF